ncbi:Uncharacterised protein [Legionella beliardensis]|uniref:Uncharacterized protein n=1 Tax=Legionella beliardensis TaxID=91822 RepID=A0A378I4R6_9GAMM|nr:hypothetical protein [Legionella beliardensis]STX29832.1 Uncharacterised protein [Legionella beliardensis]
MSALHNVFLSKNRDINHGMAIQNLIRDNGLDINEQDELGNTVLHTMAIHITENYYNPYFHKSNPEGKFINSTGYSGHFYYTNYRGPTFLDDLELLIRLGADPTLKNKNGKSASELFFRHSFFELQHLEIYFQMIQRYFPSANEIIAIINYAGFRSSPYFREECLSQRLSFYSKCWNEHELPKLLDERLLSLDCLEQLVKWIEENKCVHLGCENIFDQIKQRLNAQIKLQQSTPYFIDIMGRIEKLYHAEKNTLIRGMLLNDLSYPLLTLIQKLYEFNSIESLLNQELYNSLNQILSDYEEKRGICESLEVTVIKPLTPEEIKLIRPICASLSNILEGKMELEAIKSWNLKTNYSELRSLMESKSHLFYKQSKAVVDELNQRFSENRLVGS